ncbi:MAG: ABC transporter permease [Chitinophagaceae bacterium]|nr:ABC transporter permease [Chitinophagaceae bacterium]
MIRNFFILAWRNLLRNKIYSLINIAGLSLGLACAMLIILYTKDETSYDRFHPGVENIYRIANRHVDENGKIERGGGFTGYFHGPTFAAQVPEIDDVVRYQSDIKDVKKGEDVFREELINVDSNFLEVFHFPLVYGNSKTALKDPSGMVITEEVAKKYFGSTDVVGRTMMMRKSEEFEPFTITGVAKAPPQNSSIRFKILLPLKVPREQMLNKLNWFNFFLNTFITLKKGADPKKVEAKMNDVFVADSREVLAEMREKYDQKGTDQYFLQPFTDIHLNPDLGVGNGLENGSNPWYSYILSAIALFILLIACINFVNLTIARSIKRSREIGIRKVVGSSRKQLIVLFIGESVVLTFFSFVLAIALVEIFLPTFNKLANKNLSFTYLLDIKLVSVYLLLWMVTAFLAGSYPAIVLSGFQPVKTLYGRFSYGGKNYLQKGLVVLQFSLATILVTGTITIYKQFSYLLSKPLGYEDENLVRVEHWNISREAFYLFKESLKVSDLVKDVAPSNDGYWGTAARVNGDQSIQFAIESVDPAYIPTLGLELINGRNFKRDLPADSLDHVIINESFVREAGWKDPLGQDVVFLWDNNKRYRVIGVIKDYHFSSLNEKITPQLMRWDPFNFGESYIKIQAGADSKALAHITASFKKAFPFMPFSYSFLEDDNKREYQAEEKWKQMMLFGAAITIFISCIGLFGLSVLNAEKRTKEIGVRKVLGASVFHIAAKLSYDFMLLVIFSFLIAIPVSWYGAIKWLENYPYRISPGISMFAWASTFILLIAMATISFQSIKAALANPVKSLRTE